MSDSTPLNGDAAPAAAAAATSPAAGTSAGAGIVFPRARPSGAAAASNPTAVASAFAAASSSPSASASGAGAAATHSSSNALVSRAGRTTKDVTGELDAFELHKQKVKELELRNENLLDPSTGGNPAKTHNHMEEEKKWQIALTFHYSQAHTRVCEFLLALADAVTDRSILSVKLTADTKADTKAGDVKAAADVGAAVAAAGAAAGAGAGASGAAPGAVRRYRPAGEPVVASNAVRAVVALLDSVDALIDATPPVATASRFGNVAFRDFCDKLKADAPALLSRLLTAAPPATAAGSSAPVAVDEKVKGEVLSYLLASWGDAQRIDYGTGHELNFICFLYALSAIGVVAPSDYPALVLAGFVRYLRVVRRLQTLYYLEPAGSRGVWGLDDYHFMPFLLGSAQLLNHKHLRPKSVRSAEIVDGFGGEYMYLAAVGFINAVKLCSFAEHSPMLSDITTVKTWAKVHSGLWKMYRTEVLGKFAVVQHFLYTSLLPAAAETDQARRTALLARLPHVDPPQMQRYELPCCTAGLKIPSALAVKATEDGTAPAAAATDAPAATAAPAAASTTAAERAAALAANS